MKISNGQEKNKKSKEIDVILEGDKNFSFMDRRCYIYEVNVT